MQGLSCSAGVRTEVRAAGMRQEARRPLRPISSQDIQVSEQASGLTFPVPIPLLLVTGKFLFPHPILGITTAANTQGVD